MWYAGIIGQECRNYMTKYRLMKKSLLNISLVLSVLMIVPACQQQQQNNQTETENVMEEISLIADEVVYSADSVELKGYLVYEEHQMERRPGIIVVHEWWGHNQYARDRADRLAELGYTAFALDMYGDGVLAEHPDDAGKFAGMIMSNVDLGMARFDAAVEQLRSHPTVDPDRIAAIGYCFGGSVVLSMANTGRDLDAVAAFHSGVQLPVMPGEDLKAKVLVCNGADDPFISPESVTTFKETMDAVGADYKYISYEGAVHSFTSPYADEVGEKFDMPLKYNREADEASWEELQALLDSVF